MTGPASSRIRRRIRRAGLIALGLGLAAILGALVWAAIPMPAEPQPLAAVEADASLTLAETDGILSLTPDDASGVGLLFVPGARVAPEAYLHKLTAFTDEGVTVLVPRLPLNFAILETRSLAELTASAPGVESWLVGGHSLGGVRACQYAADNPGEVDGLVLFGSYCSVDVSASGLAVLSLGGENDALSTPADIAAAAPLLPGDAVFVEIPGATHAQFGDYGLQPGDGTSTTTDAAVRTAIGVAAAAFLASL